MGSGPGARPASSAIERCSARTSSRTESSRAAIASGRTSNPSSSSRVWEAATTVRRRSVASVAHSTCQPPSARWSTWSADAECRVAASAGAARAARRTSTGSVGLALCGIVDEPPPDPSRSSPTSGRPSASTSRATCPHASVAVTTASPTRVSGAREVCQGGTRSRPSARACSRRTACAASRPTSSTSALRVPAAPPSCAGQRNPANASAASSTPCSHPATTAPNVVGTAGWVSVRAMHGVSRCSVARSTSRRTWAARSPRTATTASRAHSTRAVSSTSWLVSPRCSHSEASSGVAERRAATSGTTGLPDDSASTASRATSSSTSDRSAGAATPAEASTSSHDCSTRTIASTSARSDMAVGARWSPGHRRELTWPSVPDR